MKQLIILILILVLGGGVQAQECNDIIHPVNSGEIIWDACVDKVENGNIVYYTKDGVSYIVRAESITSNGYVVELNDPVSMVERQYIDKYPEPLEYYEIQRRNGKVLSSVGGLFIATGIISSIIGLTMDSIDEDTRQNLVIGGVVILNIGIPLSIAGSVKAKNNNKAIKYIQRRDEMNLSLGLTSNGVGLILKF